MSSSTLFKKYKPFLNEVKKKKDYPESLRMFETDGLSVYYSPFDYINKGAKLTLVGITPGHTQAEIMAIEAVRLMNQGYSDEEVLKLCKPVGSFSGALRDLLVAQLNFFKFNEVLGIKDCASLFEKDSHLVNFTSIYKFPVFYSNSQATQGDFNNGSKQGGKKGKAEVMSFFKKYAATEFETVSDSIIVPLGSATEDIMKQMDFSSDIQKRIMPKILHASPNNRARIEYLVGARPREEMRGANSPSRVDELKHSVQAYMQQKFGIR